MDRHQAAGTGDDVVYVKVSSPSLDTTPDEKLGQLQRPCLLVNEIGEYEGAVRTPTGGVFHEINAGSQF